MAGKPEPGPGASPASGPRRRFEATVRLYAAPLYRYCWGRLRSRHLAEDAVQETFLRAWRSAAKIDPPSMGGWLFETARRCSLEILRRRKRLRVAGADGAAERAADPASAGAPAGTDFEIDEALGELNDSERALVYLKHTEGLRCREIADRLGKPLGTVTGTLARAYAKLRQALAPGGELKR